MMIIMNKFALLFISFIIMTNSISAQSAITKYCSNNNNPLDIVGHAAPWYCSKINTEVANNWKHWEPVAIGFALVSYMIAVIIFIAGIAFRNEKLRTFGIGEIYESLASILIVVFFLFISAVLFGLLPSAFFIGPVNPYYTSLNFIGSTINSTQSVDEKIFITAMTAGSVMQTSVTICAEGECINIAEPFAYAFAYLFFWPAWVLNTFLIDAIVSLYTQYYMILFFLYAAIPVFLIPGLIFRSFLPTRSLGGKMMAIAIGFYFLMPTLYAIAFASTSTNIINQLSQANSALTRYGGSNPNVLQNALSPYSPLEVQVAKIQQTFSAFWLMILFYPVLILTITYFFIIQVADIIGGMARSSHRLRGLV